MVSHLAVEHQQRYTIFALNQLISQLDCDIVYLIKLYTCVIRRKIFKSPTSDEINNEINKNLKWITYKNIYYRQQFTNSTGLLFYSLEYLSDCDTPIQKFKSTKIIFDKNNNIIHLIFNYNNESFSLATCRLNYDISSDQNTPLTTIYDGYKDGLSEIYYDYPVIFVEK